jgi:WD40 repeat protein
MTGDKVLLGGTNLMLYEYTTEESRWKLSWGMKPPNPIKIVSFSPDDRFFATVAEHDRLVKIWFRNRHKPDHHDQDTDYSYIYLPHPRSVKSLEWRHKDVLETGFIANVLFTVAMDGLVRIWTETNESEELQFHVCSVIKRESPPMLVHWLHMAHEISPNEVSLRSKASQLVSRVSDYLIYFNGNSMEITKTFHSLESKINKVNLMEK